MDSESGRFNTCSPINHARLELLNPTLESDDRQRTSKSSPGNLTVSSVPHKRPAPEPSENDQISPRRKAYRDLSKRSVISDRTGINDKMIDASLPDIWRSTEPIFSPHTAIGRHRSPQSSSMVSGHDCGYDEQLQQPPSASSPYPVLPIPEEPPHIVADAWFKQ